MKKVLTIAGSDCSGGAGIEADLKTFCHFKVYGSAVITAVVAENTVGVQGIFSIEADFVGLQIDSVMTDIGADAIKIGMLFESKIIRVVAEKLKFYNAKNVVLDPVMIAKNGDELLKKEAKKDLIEKLLPLASIVTPNINEAEAISNIKIEKEEDIFNALYKIKSFGCPNVLIKGGHFGKEAIDFFFDGNEITEVYGKRIETKNTHGTGCTYSSAIASLIASGNKPLESIKKAKEYIQKAIETAPKIGKGFGPLNHFAEK
jgi:hydroxymethylpyrimidine/phosphomethylpyrimidine kinase